MHPYANKNKTALLDTNLLTVLLVGQLGQGQIERNKKTRSYNDDDFILLNTLLTKFKTIISTPHILTETANMIDWVQGEHRSLLFVYLSQFIEQYHEVMLSAKTLIHSPAFIKLGLSDSGLFELCKNHDTVLITADSPLYGFGINHGLQVINFNHLRDQYIFSQ